MKAAEALVLVVCILLTACWCFIANKLPAKTFESTLFLILLPLTGTPLALWMAFEERRNPEKYFNKGKFWLFRILISMVAVSVLGVFIVEIIVWGFSIFSK